MNPRSIVGLAFALVLHVSFGSATAQEDGQYSLDGAVLGVGDPAPALTVQEFVRGEAVSKFERGKVYVIEFWKCGCPPCRAAIPHLNELQKKYPAVIFISVGVFTSTLDNKEYVKKSGAHMGYRVAVDRVPQGKDPYTAGAMVLGWLEPAGEEGVPTTFVVDGAGRIAWIGHPMELDDVKTGRPLEKIVSDKWDLKAAAAKFAARPGNSEAARQRVDKLPETESRAIKAIQKRTGRVVVDIRENAVTGIRFDPSRVTDAVIADLAPELQKLKQLRDLDLRSTGITDPGLKKLRELKTLQALDLGYTQVTDAGLKELREWKELQRLNLGGSRVTGAGLKELKPMVVLQTLELSGTRITSAGLKDLKALPELHVLDLSHTEVTDAMLGELRDADQLHGLNFSNTQITDAGLKQLKGLKLGALSLKNTRVEGPGLKEVSVLVESLDLSGTRVTDAGLSELNRFPNLRHLNLNGTQVTDAGLIMLRDNRKLRGLNLGGARLTDAGLKSLREMKNLEALDLSGTGVTNGAVSELKHLKQLNFLDLARTKVTNVGVADLRTAFPNLQIAY